jgi:hypothetical protein
MGNLRLQVSSDYDDLWVYRIVDGGHDIWSAGGWATEVKARRAGEEMLRAHSLQAQADDLLPHQEQALSARAAVETSMHPRPSSVDELRIPSQRDGRRQQSVLASTTPTVQRSQPPLRNGDRKAREQTSPFGCTNRDCIGC